MTMTDRSDRDLWTADRPGMDRRWQEDMAWLRSSGGVPKRLKGGNEGIMASFEKHPMLWAVAVLLLGGVAFFLTTLFLF